LWRGALSDDDAGVRFSIWPSHQQPASDILTVARHAEATGWDGVWIADHFMGDGAGFGPEEQPTLESTALLAGLATATSRIRLGSLVLGTTYRHPAVVANWAITVDHLSGGRLTLGIGAGWQTNEHHRYGIELPAVRERVDRFAEVCEITTSLLRSTRTSFSGRWFALDGAWCEPKAIQDPIPLLIGAKGDRMLGIVATWADAWNLWGLPDVVAARSAVLDRHCESIGRDPATITRTTQALVMLTHDERRARELVEAVSPRAVVAGPAARLTEVVAGWRDAGVAEVIVPDFVLGTGRQRTEAMDEIIETVAPAFRAERSSR
jgi:alkanesulfonate monooxygenase SsuD/methylene tetrahydromethanopterin reductase-like flavin-dependent oxidoreductase (luciferase family)